tara:strand:+ start:992 stop:2161 length:1170 start_codon:yes stop_codon:yes gene_type:complete
MKPWCEKYKPEKVLDLVVGHSSVEKLVSVVKKKGIALVHGPTGSGKTCTVEAIANDDDYELVETNASDFRDTGSVSRVIGGSIEQSSLFNKEKIIMIDEIDGLSGRDDRGGLPAISKFVENSSHAVVMIANDPWDKKLSALRKKSEMIEFRSINYLSIVKALERICGAEGIEHDKDILKIISRRVGGDVRSAINDLQIHACNGKLDISENNGENERIKQDSIFNAIKVVLKSNKFENALGIYDNIKEDHNEILLWLDENIPREYSGSELARAYDALGKADIFKRRIMRWQHWRYLVYIYLLMSVGVALSKTEGKRGFTMYKRSTRPLKIWMNNQKNLKRKSIAEKSSVKLHVSKKDFIKNDLPYLKLMCRNGKVPDIGLDKEEVEWLKK